MRRLLSALAIAFASLSFSPAQAGGLLQDLFAPAPRPSPVVTYYAPAQPQIRFLYDEGLRVSRRPASHRKAIVKKRQPKLWAVGSRGHSIGGAASSSRPRLERVRSMHRAHAVKSKPKFVAVAPKQEPTAHAARQVAKAEVATQIDNDPTLRVGDAYMTPEGLRIYRGPHARSKERKVFVDFRRSNIGKSVKSELAALASAGHGYQARRIGPAPLKATAVDVSARKSVDQQGRVIRVVGP